MEYVSPEMEIVEIKTQCILAASELGGDQPPMGGEDEVHPGGGGGRG